MQIVTVGLLLWNSCCVQTSLTFYILAILFIQSGELHESSSARLTLDQSNAHS